MKRIQQADFLYYQKINNMIKIIEKLYNKHQFNPWFFWIFVNFSYFTRKNLYFFFKKYSHEIKWFILDFWAWESPYKSILNYEKYITLDIEKSWHSNTKNEINYYYDWKSIPFDDNTFDSIISTEVFEHIPNLWEILLELNRILKPNWKMYITIPFSWEEHEVPYDFTRYTQFWIIHILERSWFKIINLEKSWNYIEVIFQFIVCYISSVFPKVKNKILKWLIFSLKVILISPFVLMWIFLSKILPKNDKIYLNTIILVSK